MQANLLIYFAADETIGLPARAKAKWFLLRGSVTIVVAGKLVPP